MGNQEALQLASEDELREIRISAQAFLLLLSFSQSIYYIYADVYARGMDSAKYKAPGKILWIGGYSVLERPNTSMVSAVNAYVTAEAKKRDEMEISLNAPQLSSQTTGRFDAEGRLSINVPKELILLKTAVEVASRYAVAIGHKISGVSVTTHNDNAFSYTITGGRIVKSGLGSSAAVTVAAVGAILRLYSIEENKNDAIHKLAQIAHSIATGKVGSGFDIAAAAHGSILYTRYSPEIVKGLPNDYSNGQLADLVKTDWDYIIEKFHMPKEFSLLVANFAGESMATTHGIGSVSIFKSKDPDGYADIMRRINEENNRAISALRKINSGNQHAMEEFKDAFNKGRLLTKELGVISNVEIEPDVCTELIERSEKHGAYVAKLPGAGGKDSIAALCRSEKDLNELRKFWSSENGLEILDVDFA